MRVRSYCYEVDGFGGCKMLDDANVPSLLGIPYVDKGAHTVSYDKEIYDATRKWVLSSHNPQYFQGAAMKGIGSPHTVSQSQLVLSPLRFFFSKWRTIWIRYVLCNRIPAPLGRTQHVVTKTRLEF